MGYRAWLEGVPMLVPQRPVARPVTGTYSPPAYWTERGRGYEQEAVREGWHDVENEPVLRLLDGLDFASVLEVGCGFGRVGRAILHHWPTVQYTGLDVSPDLIAGARRLLPAAELVTADLATWEPAPGRQWDLVVAVSVLGHLLPADIFGVLTCMHGWAARALVHVDWNEIGASTDYQYGHDYQAIHRAIHDGWHTAEIPYGRQTIFWERLA